MNPWIEEKACAKVNLALHILGRRQDGYHQLDSVVAFADYADHIKVRSAAQTTLEIDGPFARSVPIGTENIIFKTLNVAADFCKAYGTSLPPLEIQLTKNLPVAAGIGGGSADAAALLRAICRMLNIELSQQHVRQLASTLGADVPVCFHQKSARMEGIGELISALTINFPSAIVLANPLKPCSTQAVFQHLALGKGDTFKTSVDLENAPLWRNDLTAPAIAVEPAIGQVLRSLEAEPCFLASRMSGSGATCFGLVASEAEASAAAARLSVRNPNWWFKAARLI